MKGGMVVQVRINPKDCLGILDCAITAGIEVGNKSFASLTSAVLSSLIAMAREMKVIKEEEDGFQYANRMAPYQAGKATSARKQYAQTLLSNVKLGIQPPRLMRPSVSEVNMLSPTHPNIPMGAIDVRELTAELQGLMDKQDAGAELTPEEVNRYEYLNRVLFS